MINVYIFLEKYFLGKESDVTIRIPFQPKGFGFYHFIKKKIHKQKWMKKGLGQAFQAS
jgi:hypothetical protein